MWEWHVRYFFIFIFFSNWDGAPLGVGALLKLHTLRRGSGGNGCFVLLYFGCYVVLCVKKIKIKKLLITKKIKICVNTYLTH